MKLQSPSYLRDPRAIYELSFERVREAARLDHLDPGEAEIAARVIHACGMPDIADGLVASPGMADKAAAALGAGAPVYCDCTMVAAGIASRFLPAGNPVVVTLDDPEAEGRARELGTTRSAAAVEAWRDGLEGAVVAIGNAPTALFHLMERLADGWPRPAAIFGFPVGFVGAAESKEWLVDHAPIGMGYMSLKGTRGGSAMAAAAVNAAAIRASGNGPVSGKGSEG